MLKKERNRQVLFSKPCDIPAKTLQQLTAAQARLLNWQETGRQAVKSLLQTAGGRRRAGWEGGGVGWFGRLFKAGRLSICL